MRYSCFGLDLDPDILPGPLYPLNERRLPISLFSCLFWYLLSRRIAFALFGTQSFPPLHSLPLLPYFPFSLTHLSWYFLITPHRPCTFELRLSRCTCPSASFFVLYPQSSSRRPCSSLALKESQLLELCFLPFLIFIIIPRIVPAFSSFIPSTRGFSHRRPIFICFSFCVIALLIIVLIQCNVWFFIPKIFPSLLTVLIILMDTRQSFQLHRNCTIVTVSL